MMNLIARMALVILAVSNVTTAGILLPLALHQRAELAEADVLARADEETIERQRAEQAQRDRHWAEETKRALKENADLRQVLDATRRELRDKGLILAMLRERGIDEGFSVQAPIPDIDCVVVAVRPVADDPLHPLALLNAGEDNGVEEGYQFTIHRNDQFVGRVQVVRVLRDMSRARVLFTRDESTTIEPGDNASTRIE